jgi:dihydrofolate reductase
VWQAVVVPKTQYYTATTLDGYLAGPGNSLDWLLAAEERSGSEANAARGRAFTAFFEQVGAIVMGATTYESIVDREGLLAEPARWPYGQVPCWVLTHRRLPVVSGAPVSFAAGDVAAVHKEMTEAAGGRNVWLVGGGEVVGQFADLGLVDEIILAVAPATAGAGAPLLPRVLGPAELSLTACRHDDMFVYLSYAVSYHA